MDDFSPNDPIVKVNAKFVVKSVVKEKRTIKIFDYPILPQGTRDLMLIPGVSESSVRGSLLKGEIKLKLLAKEIEVVESTIDLLQFDEEQKQFLIESGVSLGTSITNSQNFASRKEDILLTGLVDDSNTVFYVPDGPFLQDANYKIIVYKNGVKQLYLDDYFIAESGGIGSGYDTVIFTTPPATTPSPNDVITADYYIKN